MAVDLKVYNLLGQEVRTLVSGTRSAGVNRVLWDGQDAFGIKVPSGIYIYRLSSSAGVITRKMTLMK